MKASAILRTSLVIGLLLSLFALGAIAYEWIVHNRFGVQSLYGHLSIGLLFIYLSTPRMLDERIQFLKFKSLAIGFVIGLIGVNLLNYLITFPDGYQTEAISSYTFALICLVIAFITFFVLQTRE